MGRNLVFLILIFSASRAFAAPLCQVHSPAPALTLLGERHHDQRMQSVESDDLAEARAGKVIFAEEGWVIGHPGDSKDWPEQLGLTTSQSVGMEDERPYSVTLFILNLTNYRDQFLPLAQATTQQDIARVAGALLASREARKAILPGLDRYSFTRALSSTMTWPASTLTQVVPSPTDEQVLAWIGEELNWAKALQEFTKILASRLSENPPFPEYDPKIVTEGLSFAASCQQFARLRATLAVNWRNESMGRHIAEAYCTAAKEGKGVTALVGEDHIPGLHRILNGLLPTNVHPDERDLNELSPPRECPSPE